MTDLRDDLRALVGKFAGYEAYLREHCDPSNAKAMAQAYIWNRAKIELEAILAQPSTPPLTREALEEAERQGVAMPHEDYDWALERVTKMCASALVDAQLHGRKLLKGFGYPDEIMCRAQDFRALSIVLDAILARHGTPPLTREALEEAERQGTETTNHYGERLTVGIENQALVIRIGVQTLAHAVSYANWANPYDDEAHDYIRTFAITDPTKFAEDVKRALLAEEEDGSSLLSDVLDTASEGAVDDGSEACEYEQRIKTGETASSETWAKRQGGTTPQEGKG